MSGSTDHIIRIYQMTPGPPERIAELDVHNVSSLFSRFMYCILNCLPSKIKIVCLVDNIVFLLSLTFYVDCDWLLLWSLF